MRARELVDQARRALAAAGIESAAAEARLLAAFALGVRPGDLVFAPDPTDDQVTELAELVRRRAGHVPLQHLTGQAPFRHLVLHVGPGVFIPRPETESLVEWGLAHLPPHATVVDLCAGSGAIAASVATESPTSRVVAVERDPAALEYLRRNVPAGVTVVAGSIFDPLAVDGRAELVLCNPPYVPTTATLPPEVTEHDPTAAVFAGVDGLDVIRPLVPRLATLLAPGGACGVEHDETQAEAVPALFTTDGRFERIALHHDLAGRPRFTTAVRLG